MALLLNNVVIEGAVNDRQSVQSATKENGLVAETAGAPPGSIHMVIYYWEHGQRPHPLGVY